LRAWVTENQKNGENRSKWQGEGLVSLIPDAVKRRRDRRNLNREIKIKGNRELCLKVTAGEGREGKKGAEEKKKIEELRQAID